ncbi:uncharacterized protein [Penaeus vannamei]|uniref:uncharacterized protein n=1 Tax=Penaeus vannamei TaxID=6689 RepID=UPI00387F5DD1
MHLKFEEQMEMVSANASVLSHKVYSKTSSYPVIHAKGFRTFYAIPESFYSFDDNQEDSGPRMASSGAARREEAAAPTAGETKGPADEAQELDVDARLKDFLRRISKDARDVLELARTQRLGGILVRQVMERAAGDLGNGSDGEDDDDGDEETRLMTMLLSEDVVERKVKTLLEAATDEGRRATAAEDLARAVNGRLGDTGAATLGENATKETARHLENAAKNMDEARRLCAGADCTTRRAMATVMRKILAVMRTRMTLDLEKSVEMRVTVMLCDFVTDERRRERLVDGLATTMRKGESGRREREGGREKEGEKQEKTNEGNVKGGGRT